MFRGKSVRIANLERALNNAIEANERLQSRAFLFGIERQGRINKFLFMRNGKLIVIETMGLISDPIAEWERMLIE